MKRWLSLIGALSLLSTSALLACSEGNGGGQGGEETPDSGTSELVDSSTPPPPDGCTPMTVEEAIAASCGKGQIECGAAEVADGCGERIAIDCPACAEGEACNASNVCVAKGEASCVPEFTREEAIATYCGEGAGRTECGAVTLADGCAGITIDCGGCGEGDACSNSGTCIPLSCTPTITEEEAIAQTCGNAVGQIECGTRRVNNGCGVYEITCACAGELSCDTSTNTCVEVCTPLNSNTAYAHYCRQPPTYWECGGKIERDDGCGGTVMVNCGESDRNCKNGTECDLDPTSDNYLHCVNTACVPEVEADEAFCARYHAECGEVSGEDSCGNVRKVTCPSCSADQICAGAIGGSGSSTYIEQSCAARPEAIPLKACQKVQGDTSDSKTATSVMVIGEGFTNYQYTAPEIVYAYTATADGEVTISATPYNDPNCVDGKDGYDLVLYVLTSLESRTAFRISSAGSYCEGESLTFTAEQGKTYYAVVDGNDWDSAKYEKGPFQIEIDDGTCAAASTGGKVVISALYAGGSTGTSNKLCDPANLGPTTLIGTSSCEVFHQDYIELHNTGSESVDISGWSVFVSPLNSVNNWQLRTTIDKDKSIPAGGYYLIGEKTPDNSQNQLGDDIQDIPAVDARVNNFGLGENGHKILIAAAGVTSASLKGTACPSEEQGILFVYGGSSVCGSQLAAPAANQLYHSADGCSAPELTDFTVVANPVTDEFNNMTHPITLISPIPRNSESAPNVCQ